MKPIHKNAPQLQKIEVELSWMTIGKLIVLSAAISSVHVFVGTLT